MQDAAGYAAIMVLAGIGIPVLAALNAALGVHLGSTTAASLVLFGVAFAAALCAYLLVGGTFAGFGGAPRHLFLAGLFVAFYVLSITWVAPRFGVGNAIFFVLLGQLVAAAVIDHFGLFGARIVPLSPIRALGLALIAFGIFVTQVIGRP